MCMSASHADMDSILTAVKEKGIFTKEEAREAQKCLNEPI